jgi:hypothetical protein
VPVTGKPVRPTAWLTAAQNLWDNPCAYINKIQQKMNRLLTVSLLLLLLPASLLAQGEIDEQQRIFYRNERTVGLLFNSNGYGISYREGKRLNLLNKRLIDIDINLIKHPKEIKLVNPYVISGSSFVYGKLNHAVTIRGMIGHQHELFRKVDLGGVAVRYFYSGGPSVAVTKPIYYNILYPSAGGTWEIRAEKFVEGTEPTDIYNKASFFKGFRELGFIPGVAAKGGFNFEYSKEDKVIHTVEIGISLEAYLKRVPVMASDDNQALFLTPFISYRLGVVIDPLHPESVKIPTLFFRK